MNKAVFLLSFDCEGKWGAADQLAAAGYDGLTTAGLVAVHRRLCGMLSRHRMAATFAFVSSHFLTEAEVRARPDWFSQAADGGVDWPAAFRADLASRNIDGWLCPGALDIVRASGVHEIASHGFSHVPLGESDIGLYGFRRQLALVREAEALRGLAATTFVFPRNRVGLAYLLPSHGFEAYRPPVRSDRRGGLPQRGWRYLNDISPFEEPQGHGRLGRPIALPPGRYLIVRRGARRWIPTALLRDKFERMVERTVEQNGVLHFFTHPEDFLLGADQFDVLEALLAAVTRRVRRGEMQVMTLAEYCTWLEDAGSLADRRQRNRRQGAGRF